MLPENPIYIMVLAVCIGLVGTCVLCRERTILPSTRTDLDNRVREITPYFAAVALFFLAKRVTHNLSLEISYALDWDITNEIYAIEGGFVTAMQDVVPEVTLGFFAVMYMVGFPYLLVTAPVLYFLLPTQRRLKELLVAYLLNYLIGGICYTLFIAYGPRNHLSSVDGLMYQFYPRTQDVTAAVSAKTNVFPSLHTSLAIVVLLFAWRSRREYPRWLTVTAVVATSVVFSTTYLGIHWLVDVAAGALLAVWSVSAAERLVARVEGDTESIPTSDESEESIATDAEIGD